MMRRCAQICTERYTRHRMGWLREADLSEGLRREPVPIGADKGEETACASIKPRAASA